MGSGGGSTTTTVDPVYNAGMLKLSQEEQGWAKDMFNQFKYGVAYDPNEAVWGKTIDGKFVTSDQFKNDPNATQYLIENPEWTAWNNANNAAKSNPDGSPNYNYANIDPATGKPKPEPERFIANQNVLEQKTLGDINGYDPNAQISEMQYLQNLVESNASLLGLQTSLSSGQLQSQLNLLPQQEKVASETLGLTSEQIAAQRKLLPAQTAAQESRLGLYNTTLADINKGIDVTGRMDQAGAEAQHAYKNADTARRIEISSFGLDPSAGRYASQNRAAGLAEAGAVAGARTAAKNQAETEDFQRKTTGLQLSV